MNPPSETTQRRSSAYPLRSEKCGKRSSCATRLRPVPTRSPRNSGKPGKNETGNRPSTKSILQSKKRFYLFRHIFLCILMEVTTQYVFFIVFWKMGYSEREDDNTTLLCSNLQSNAKLLVCELMRLNGIP